MSAAAIAALPRRPPPDPRQLQRCLLLAVLLHVWLVLVFGNATGSAAPGQGVWGSLTVKLLGRSGGDAGAAPGAPDSGMAGQGQSRVRPVEPVPAEAPGAAELGRRSLHEAPPAAEPSPEPPRTSTLKLPEGFRPVDRENLATPPREVAPVESPAPSAMSLPPTVSRLEIPPEAAIRPLEPAVRLRPPSRAAELVPSAVELPPAVRRLEADPAAATGPLPRPAELRASPAPTMAVPPSLDLPAPVKRLEAPSEIGAISPLPRPADLRGTQPSISAQPTPSTALPPTVQRLEAPTNATTGIAPLPRASDLRIPGTASTTSSALPDAQDMPTSVRRLESTDGTTAIEPLKPAPSPRTSLPAAGASALQELSNALPGPATAPAGPAGQAQGDPNANPSSISRTTGGSPDAGSRLGPDLAVPPSAAASTPRAPLNLSLPRGDIAARRGPGLVDMLPQPPERKSKLEQSIEDAANKDCRKAYAGAGLLAAVPLTIDAARGKGCKW